MTSDESEEMDKLEAILQSDFPECVKLHKDLSLQRGEEEQAVRVYSIEHPERGIFHAGITWPSPNWGISTAAESIGDTISIIRRQVEVATGQRDDDTQYSIHDSKFSEVVFLYTNTLSEAPFTEEEARQSFKENGYELRIRDEEHRESLFSEDNWDLFISHDSSDSDFASALYGDLFRRKVNCWIDESVLELGDSLTQRIDEGTSKCDYAVIILSENFIENVGWASDEWEGLRVRAASEDRKMIIPIWCNVTRDMVMEFSPWLADKQAAMASDIDDTERVADEIKSVIID